MLAGSLVGVALEVSMPRSISGVAADVNDAKITVVGVPDKVGVAARVFPRDGYEDRVARDAAIADWLDELGVELVVLSGYMAILDGAFIARFAGRIVNVHPSLLPAFTGLHAVQQAVDYGVKVFGVTVHFVDEGVDTGPVILQDSVVLENAVDADEVLAALRPLEHRLLPEAVRLVAAGAVQADPAVPRRMLIRHER